MDPPTKTVGQLILGMSGGGKAKGGKSKGGKAKVGQKQGEPHGEEEVLDSKHVPSPKVLKQEAIMDAVVTQAVTKYEDSKDHSDCCQTCTLKKLMKIKYQRLLDGNRLFSERRKREDPEFFQTLAKGQKPDYLWIGCSDSRVPANEITHTGSGRIFVHRNIANVVISTDMNLLSVLHYAVQHLQVSHIIVCGHYGCGGIKAAASREDFGLLNAWLSPIRQVAFESRPELDKITDPEKREHRLVELNVLAQVKNLAAIDVVQKAWDNRELQIHGWVYGLSDGLITDLGAVKDRAQSVPKELRFKR